MSHAVFTFLAIPILGYVVMPFSVRQSHVSAACLWFRGATEFPSVVSEMLPAAESRYFDDSDTDSG